MANASPGAIMASVELASVYLELREAITRAVPGAHGLAPTEDLPHAWGVMLDVGLPPGPVTVVVIADGTASLHLGNGGATVGAVGVPSVAEVARVLLSTRGAHTLMGRLARYVPILGWLLRHDRSWLSADAVAAHERPAAS